MSRSFAPLLLILGCGASAGTHASEMHPQDFAYGMPIETTTAGTAYRFTLPVEVFTRVVHEDLRDLRVFNAAGAVVPYELEQTPPGPTHHPLGPSLPLFPLHGDAHVTLSGLRVTIHSQGTAVDLQTGAASADPHVITNYVLDARQMARPLSGLLLHWPDGAPEFSGNVRVEASDDLGSWRILSIEAPIIHLATGGSELNQNRIEFPSTKGGFWRLTWVGKTAPFELTSVTAEETVDQPIAPQSMVTASGTRLNKESELSFDLGARLPVTRVNLVLPESNSVLEVELLSRARSGDPWRSIARRQFYRVSTGSSPHSNEPVPIATDFDRFWLVRQIQPTGPIAEVRLQAAWDATDVVFLAQGSGPYLLAYGDAAADSSSIALDRLVKGITLIQANAGPSYVLGGVERLRPLPRTVPWRMTLLWSALGLGVALLAWMAYRLSRELGSRTADTGTQ